jgi:hypothetical protein
MPRILRGFAFVLFALIVFAAVASAQVPACPDYGTVCGDFGYVGNGFYSGGLGNLWGGANRGQHKATPLGEVHIATKAKDVQIYLDGYDRGLSGSF